ncbi:amidohydrolase family protein [Thermodesulfobacteriota bacterium]
MSDYEIIDVHIHTYQSAKIGLQAMGGEALYGYSGSIEETLGYMKDQGVSKCVMVNLLPSGDMRDVLMNRLPYGLPDYLGAVKGIDGMLISRAIRRNEWSCEVSREHPELITFITLDLSMDPQTMKNEILDKINNHGAKGIKLHPSAQRFYPYDRRLWPCYETAQELGIPIIVHAGELDMFPTQFALPKYYLDALHSFPELPLVLAHIARPFWDEAKDMAKRFPNLTFDCTGILHEDFAQISDEFFVSMVREIGVERVMFGTDIPFVDPAPQIERMKRLDLSEEEKRLIFSENAKRILKI